MSDIVLLAASGLAREVASAQLSGIQINGILDDNVELHGTECAGLPVLGSLERVRDLDAQFVLCMGNGRARRETLARLARIGLDERHFARVIDDSVRIPPRCSVGAGSIVLAGSVLTASVQVGRHVVIMPNVTLTHDNVIDDFVTVAAGVSLGGAVHVQEAAYLGMNSSVRQGLTVGREAVVGMGAAVLTSVPEGEVWLGVPARAMATKGEHQ